jgi:hypothetical protein
MGRSGWFENLTRKQHSRRLLRIEWGYGEPLEVILEDYKDCLNEIKIEHGWTDDDVIVMEDDESIRDIVFQCPKNLVVCKSLNSNDPTIYIILDKETLKLTHVPKICIGVDTAPTVGPIPE